MQFTIYRKNKKKKGFGILNKWHILGQEKLFCKHPTAECRISVKWIKNIEIAIDNAQSVET